MKALRQLLVYTPILVGLIVFPMCDDGEGEGEDNCEAGETECGSVCVDTNSDHDNCGSCGNACAADETCNAGSCSSEGCGTGLTDCSGSCVDTQTDRNNCGSCGNSCGTGETCSGGSCSGGGEDCGDLQYSDEAACQSCVEDMCCDELLACDTGTTCGDLWTCLDGCDDDTCSDACMASHGDGQPAGAALIECVEASCDEDCVSTDGICGTELMYENEAMNACLTENCCESYMPCYEDAACNACMQDIEAPGCDGNALFTTYLACRDEHCPTSLCGTDLGYGSVALNECVNASCCESYTPCFDDTACNACLQDPEAAGCDENALFTTFTTCKDTACPSDVCDTEIGYYSNGTEPLFECNLCLEEHCCTPLETCVGDGSDAARELCLACLNDTMGADCTDTAIAAAATEFDTCTETNCAAVCSDEE